MDVAQQRIGRYEILSVLGVSDCWTVIEVSETEEI